MRCAAPFDLMLHMAQLWDLRRRSRAALFPPPFAAAARRKFGSGPVQGFRTAQGAAGHLLILCREKTRASNPAAVSGNIVRAKALAFRRLPTHYSAEHTEALLFGGRTDLGLAFDHRSAMLRKRSGSTLIALSSAWTAFDRHNKARL